MYQDINSPFHHNPYDDNQKFLKQILSKPFMLGIIISLGLILAVNVYQLINIFLSPISLNSSELMENYPELYNSIEGFLKSLSTPQAIYQCINIVVYLIPFIGFVLLYIRSKNTDDLSSIKPGVTILKVFSVVSLILMILSMIFIIIIMVMLFSIYQSPTEIEPATIAMVVVIISLFVCIPAFVLELFWTISVFRLCSSAQKSIDGEPLTSKGATPVGVFSIISACILGLSVISSLPSLIVSFNVSSLITFISSAAMTSLNIFIAILVFAYRKAVNDANYSIAYSGANRYTSNTSNYTTYYQSQYQNPYTDTSNPPQNTQSFQQSNFPYNNQSFQQPDYQQQSFPTICPFCGANISPNENFCNNCGTRIR